MEKYMSKKILVTFASRSGSTQGVAEAIGRTLAEAGLAVEVLPMAAVHDLSPYAGVVAGSAIQAGAWLPEAMRFLGDHRAQLSSIPCAAFLVCMTLAIKEGEYRSHVASWMDPVRALIQPKSVGLFCGALDIRKIPSLGQRIKFKLSTLLGVWSEGDHRDWAAIRAWALQLPAALSFG